MATSIEVQEQHDLICEKINDIRNDLVTAIDPSVKFKLEKDLEKAEKEKAKLEKQLSFLKEDRIIFSLAGMPNEVHCIFNSHAQIGRSPSCDFWIDDKSEDVSRFHALISYKLDTNEYWIEDLKSLSGIYVDGVKIEKPTQLVGGTKIQLGASLSLLFEHDKNDPLCPCVIIQHDDKGKELVRYILIPKGKALVGTNPKEVVQFPMFREHHSLGSLEKRPDGFYFISVNNEEILLEHHQILELDFVPIEVSIFKVVPQENLEQTKTLFDSEPSFLESEKEVKKPSGDELPSNIDKIRVILGLVIIFFGVILPFIFKPDPNNIISNWIQDSAESLKNLDKKFITKKYTFPPQSIIKLACSKSLENSQIENFLENSDLSDKVNRENGNKIECDYLIDEKEQNSPAKHFRKELEEDRDPNFTLLIMIAKNRFGLISFKSYYWTPESNNPEFQWSEKPYFLYSNFVIIFGFTCLIAIFTHTQIIEGYRNKLQDDYDNFQKRRTARIFTAQSNLDEARKLAQSGELAKSLSKINNEVLNSISKSMPLYKEAIYLKNSILKQISAGGGSITVPRLSPERLSPTNNSKVLYLRILGTPYAYQAPYGLETIRIGRQRRKPNSTEENVGNDVILRVPGSNKRSLRISRRHLEIKWINDEYYVIDKSGGQTKLNGQILKPNEPCRLESGNRLFIAGVITLEVLIRSNISGTKINNVLRIDSPESQDALLLEASIGDMVTEVFDD